jgi:hypothetical protein
LDLEGRHVSSSSYVCILLHTQTLLPDCYLDLEGLGIPVEDVLGMICPQWFISVQKLTKIYKNPQKPGP